MSEGPGNADSGGRYPDLTEENVRSRYAMGVHAMTGTGNVCERCGSWWTDEIHRWPPDPSPVGSSEAGDAGIAG